MSLHDTDRTVSISCNVAQGGQGKYFFLVLYSLGLIHRHLRI